MASGLAEVAAPVAPQTSVVVYPAIEPLVALVISSAVAMVLAYLGMRFAAFRHRGGGPRD